MPQQIVPISALFFNRYRLAEPFSIQFSDHLDELQEYGVWHRLDKDFDHMTYTNFIALKIDALNEHGEDSDEYKDDFELMAKAQALGDYIEWTKDLIRTA